MSRIFNSVIRLTGRLVATSVFVVAAIANDATAAPPAKSDTEVQKAVLEATQRSAQTAIETTQKSADAAIKSADRATEAVKTAYMWTSGWIAAMSGLITFILGLAVFAGWITYRDTLKSVAAVAMEKLDQAVKLEVGKTAKALENLEKLNLKLVILQQNERAMATQISDGDASYYLALNEEILVLLNGLVEGPEKSKLHSYIYTVSGDVCFRAKRWSDAVEEFRKAVASNVVGWTERNYNLACALECKYLNSDSRRKEDRTEAAKLMRSWLEADDNADAALHALKDDDFRSLFTNESEILNLAISRLKEYVNGQEPKQPEIRTDLLKDRDLEWLLDNNAALKEWLTQKLN